ncbi:MAG: WD40/YVTN/BNR-like repeat-containing protein [Candidatus Limnocylindrales bacterium]
MKRSRLPSDPHEPDEVLDRRLADFLRREAGRVVRGRRSDAEVVAAIRRRVAHRRRSAMLGALAVAAVLVVALVGSVYLAGAVKPGPALPVAPAPTASPAASYPRKLWPVPTATLAPSVAAATVDLAGTFPGGGLWAMRGSAFLVSADAGASWRQSTLPTLAPQSEQMVVVLDAEHAWYVVVGPGASPVTGAPTDILHYAVYRTSDGGRTWQQRAVPGNYPATAASLVFVDPKHGDLLCSAERFSSGTSTVLWTTDGGASWQVVGTAAWIGSMFAASDPSTLWAGAPPEAGPVAHPLLAASRDGGRTWQDVSLPGLSAGLGGAARWLAGPPVFRDASTGVVTVTTINSGFHPETWLYRTSDGGHAWSLVADRPMEAAAGPALLDATHWLLPLVNPLGVAASSDGGFTWHDLGTRGLGGVANPGWIAWIGGLDASHAAALVPTGHASPGPAALYLSADGGASWHAADVTGVAVNPIASPFGQCPHPAPLAFDPEARANAVAAARAAVPTLYKTIDTAGYEVQVAAPANSPPVARYGSIVRTLCGPLTQSGTYVVELRFPAMEPSASLSQGQLFVGRLGAGWQVWYQYH